MTSFATLPLLFSLATSLPWIQQTDGEAPENAASTFDLSSLIELWKLREALANETAPTESQWSAFFETPASRHVVRTDRGRKQTRAWIEAAFRPSAAEERARLEAEGGFFAVRFARFVRADQSKAELDRFLADVQRRGVLAQADQLAREHLPDDGRVTAPVPPVRFTLFAPEAYAAGDALVIDVLLAIDLGQQLPLVLAHELHHYYYERIRAFEPLKDDPHSRVVHALRQLHLEGLADRIDKGEYPIDPIPGFPPHYAPAFNQHYEQASSTLQAFDQSLNQLAQTEDPKLVEELAQKVWGLFHFGAHPEGFYMAQQVAEAFGPDLLIEETGDAFAFLRSYRRACLELGRQDPIRPRSQQYLDQLEARVKGR